MLAKYLVPSEEINEFTSRIRLDTYEMFRDLAINGTSICSLKRCPSNVEMSLFQVQKDSAVEGKSIIETGLESGYDVNVLVIFRNSQKNEILPNPDENTIFYADDTAVLLGSPENISKLANLFQKDR